MTEKNDAPLAEIILEIRAISTEAGRDARETIRRGLDAASLQRIANYAAFVLGGLNGVDMLSVVPRVRQDDE